MTDDLLFAFWFGGVRGLGLPSIPIVSNLVTRSMMPLLILREVLRVLAVSPSEIQPCAAPGLSWKST
jgi:hypothetical protein